MRFSIFGIWIALISIVECQPSQASECYDLLAKVTVEVSHLIQSSICADSSPSTIVIDSEHGFWFGNLEGFCTSSVLNTGTVEMNYLISSRSLTIQLLKNGGTLDAAKVQVNVDGNSSGTHLITVWGHQNTRFVLKVLRQCRNVQTPSNGATTPGRQATTTNAIGNTTRQTTSTTTDSGQGDKLEKATKEQNSKAESSGGCTIFTIAPNGTVICDKKSTTTQNSLENSKIEWMEQKRVEFEKTMDRLREWASEEEMHESEFEFWRTSSVSEMTTSTASNVDGSTGGHVTVQDGGFNTQIIPAFVTSVVVQPTLVSNNAISSDNNLVMTIPVNTDIFPSAPEIIPTISLSTGPAAFFHVTDDTNQLPLQESHASSTEHSVTPVDSTSAILSPTPSLLLPGELRSSSTTTPSKSTELLYPSQPIASKSTELLYPSQPIASKSTEFLNPSQPVSSELLSTHETPTQITHAMQSRNIPSHSSESSVLFASWNPNFLDSTHISSSYVATPIISSSEDSLAYSSTIYPSSSPHPDPPHIHQSGTPTSLPTIHQIGQENEHSKWATSAHTENGLKTESTTESSTIPQKETEEDSLQGESFWPVVAALVVGIPSVLVFGIAIVVIHRRRTPMSRKFFAMKSFSNMSTPSSSSLPGYINFKSKRDSSSQSSV